jgi:hypothetical protein
MFAEIAPPNSQMTREFRSKLPSQFAHMNGDLLCFSCHAQTLKLHARDGFYVIKDVLNKIRGCVEYVNATPINQDKFREAINNVKLQDMKAASHDDPTRWETTFVMLMSALELREAFTQIFRQFFIKQKCMLRILTPSNMQMKSLATKNRYKH